jgi:hypothetical protein
MMNKATIPADMLIFTNGRVIDGTEADPICGGNVVLHFQKSPYAKGTLTLTIL